MAKKEQLLQWAGIGFIIYLIANQVGGAILDRLSIDRPSIQLGRISTTGIEVTIKVPVINATALSLPLDSLQATINYGGQPLTNVLLNQNIQIAANDSTVLTFAAVLDYVQLSQSVANIIDSRTWLQALTFQGHAVSSGIVFPFNETFSVGV